MTPSPALAPAAGVAEIRTAILARDVTATEMVEAALSRIEQAQGQLNAFTTVTADRARAQAAGIDARIAAGQEVGPLAGVPFAAKDLFDLAGVTTRAGSEVLTDRPLATADAAAVSALRDADAIVMGALTMDEFAFGFTTENSHVGPARNPHDPTRTPGGSSGGSGAAVAAGLVSLALGTDTNGSVRVPASLCGLFAIKPTYGQISRDGVQLFCDSLDHVGLFARSAADLQTGYHVLASAPGPAPVVGPAAGRDRLRVGRLGGWFAEHAGPDALEALDLVAGELGESAPPADLKRARAAHAAASVITYAEAGELHLDRIRHHRDRFDPVVRHRLVAGALLPADWYVRAQRVRSVWAAEVDELFADVDVLLAPATPFVAPEIGTETVTISGEVLPARPALGWLTQPLTPTGLPIGVAPVWPGDGQLPIGVQVIAPAGQERRIMTVLNRLESSGVARSHVPQLTS